MVWSSFSSRLIVPETKHQVRSTVREKVDTPQQRGRLSSMKSTLQEHANLKKREAEKLWDELRTSFHITADKIEKIIYTKAWIPLGYDSFTDAWTAEVGNIPLAAELRAHVIYQMFSDGLSPEDVAEHVKNVAPRDVENIFRQKKSGVPPELASLHVVRKHVRKNPSPSDTVHITLGVERFNRYKEIAEKHGEKYGRSVENIMLAASIPFFEELAGGEEV